MSQNKAERWYLLDFTGSDEISAAVVNELNSRFPLGKVVRKGERTQTSIKDADGIDADIIIQALEDAGGSFTSLTRTSRRTVEHGICVAEASRDLDGYLAELEKSSPTPIADLFGKIDDADLDERVKTSLKAMVRVHYPESS